MPTAIEVTPSSSQPNDAGEDNRKVHDVPVEDQLRAVEEETYNAQRRVWIVKEAQRGAATQYADIQAHLKLIDAGIAQAHQEGEHKRREVATQQALLRRAVITNRDASLRALLEQVYDSQAATQKVQRSSSKSRSSSARRSPSAPARSSSLSQPTATSAIRKHITEQLKAGTAAALHQQDVCPATTHSRPPPCPIRSFLDEYSLPYTLDALEAIRIQLDQQHQAAEVHLAEVDKTLSTTKAHHATLQQSVDDAASTITSLNNECREQQDIYTKHLERANHSKHQCRLLDYQVTELSDGLLEKGDVLKRLEAETVQLNSKLTRYASLNTASTEEVTSQHGDVTKLQGAVVALEGEVEKSRLDCTTLSHQLKGLLAAAPPPPPHRLLPPQQPDPVAKAVLGQVLASIAETSKLVASTSTTTPYH